MLSEHEMAEMRACYDGWLEKFRQTFDLNIRPKLIVERLGSTAGRARGIELIRISPDFWRRNTAEMKAQTIPHEIAHCYAHAMFPFAKQGHGPEWRSVMRRMGLEPTRCHSYDVTGIVKRHPRNYAYKCACADPHKLTELLHRRIQAGQNRTCKICKQRVVYGGPVVKHAEVDVKFS